MRISTNRLVMMGVFGLACIAALVNLLFVDARMESDADIRSMWGSDFADLANAVQELREEPEFDQGVETSLELPLQVWKFIPPIGGRVELEELLSLQYRRLERAVQGERWGEALRIARAGLRLAREVRRTATTYDAYIEAVIFDEGLLDEVEKIIVESGVRLETLATYKTDYAEESLGEFGVPVLVRENYLSWVDTLESRNGIGFKVRQTRNALAEEVRYELSRWGTFVGDDILLGEPVSKNTMMAQGNWRGAERVRQLRAVNGHIESWELALLARRRVLMARYLVQMFTLTHGGKPPRFAELSPGLIEVLPMDPYDGKPIRYRASDGRIWSLVEEFR